MDNQVGMNTGALASSSISHRRPLEKFFGRDWKIALIFILPTVIIMGVLIFVPFVKAIQMSTTSMNLLTGETMQVGLRNYTKLFSSSDYQQAIQNTIQFTVWSILIKFIIGMTIALILNSKLPFRNILTGVMLLPWIVPEIVTALAWKSIYDPLFGALNPILLSLGVLQQPLGWLSDPNLAMPSVISVNVWKGIPFYTILLLAGLKAIDRELLEAAEVDGANVVKRFRHITLPGMRFVIVVTLLLSFISTFNNFGLIFLMTGGGPGGATKVYSILAWEKAVAGIQRGPGAAIAFSVAPLMMVMIWLLARFMRQDEGRGFAERKVSIGDRLAKSGGALLGILLDLIFWPAEMILHGFEALSKAVRSRRQPEDRARPMFTMAQRERTSIVLRIVILIPIMIFVLFPFYWVIITSFKTTPQISERISLFWPTPWTTEQYRTLLQDTPFLIWFKNTILVAVSSTTISVTLAALGAYALTRLKFLGAGLLTTLLLITYLLPGTLLFIPLYQILSDLGLFNTYGALILTYPTFLLPFATWVMIGYFRGIPVDLEEAAMIDGASRLRAFWRITLPLAMPGLLSVTLIAFTTAWNEFLFAFVFINSESLRTLPIGLQSMIVGDILPWGKLMAASLLMAIPVVVLYTYAQRFLVEGLTLGGVKG